MRSRAGSCGSTTAGRAGSWSSRTRWPAPRSTKRSDGATLRAQHRRGGDRGRPGRRDAPSRRGGDGRRRCAARRARSTRARRDVARRMGRRGIEPDRREPAEPGPGRSRAPRAGGDRGDDVLRRRGSGATAGRADGVRRGPRRDSVLAYLAMFAGRSRGGAADARPRVGPARARRRRPALGDDRAAQRLPRDVAPARPRSDRMGRRADRARARGPGQRPARRSVAGARVELHRQRDQAHAALDRWLDDPAAPPPGAGFVLLALKGFLLLAEGDVRGARAAFETSRDESLSAGLLVVAALSLSGSPASSIWSARGTARWSRRSAPSRSRVESEDRWVIGQAHWSATYVPARCRRMGGRRGPRARDPRAGADASSATWPPSRSPRRALPRRRSGPATC